MDAPSRTQKSVAHDKAHPLLEYKVCVGRVVHEAGRPPVVVDVIRVVVDDGGGGLLWQFGGCLAASPRAVL